MVHKKICIKKKVLKKLNLSIHQQIKFLLSNLKLKNKVFVHRDFHVSNLMKHKNQLAIIDSQDAVIGNEAYDLASLIDDVRFISNNKLKKKFLIIILDLKKNLLIKLIF